MRRAVLAVIVTGSLFARAETPPPRPPATAPLGFDHAIHARDVGKASKPAVACARCHVMRAGVLVGKPNHASCFGDCHMPVPTKNDPPPVSVLHCNPCHAETALATPKNLKPLAVAYPPYVLAPDHAVQLGHKAHAAIPCAACHDKRPQTQGVHRRCIACHDGSATKSFAMTECERCHPTGSGVPKLARAESHIVVTSAFSHGKHATRGAAKQCVTCHAPIAATDARELPRPAMETCAVAGCHDGTAVFGTTNSCTKCHKDVPPIKLAVDRAVVRFKHSSHDSATLACSSCHPLGKSNEVLVTGHAPCAPCHAKEFGSSKPKICTACHNGFEPWRHLVADREPADTTEFGVSLDHGKHAQPCASCHVLGAGGSQLRPPRGHVACMKSGCHATTGGPPPQLASCDGCHQRNLIATRTKLRTEAKWSVRTRFRHAPHRTDKGAELACIACHTDMTSATVAALATPAKQTCARCHDGKDAFSLTGTSCTRCHDKGSR